MGSQCSKTGSGGRTLADSEPNRIVQPTAAQPGPRPSPHNAAAEAAERRLREVSRCQTSDVLVSG